MSVEAAHEATGGGAQQLRVTLEAPLCSRVLDVREAHELLYEHALNRLWLPGTLAQPRHQTTMLKWGGCCWGWVRPSLGTVPEGSICIS